jgi:Alginate export
MPQLNERLGFGVALIFGAIASSSVGATAEEAVKPVETIAKPTRPAILTNRWQEDWSALADLALRTEPLDSLKYIPLFITDSKSYVSLGATLRERFESNDAAGFGVGKVAADAYLLQRLQIHADIRFNEHWQVFVQIEDDRAFEKTSISPADQDPLDLRLAFVAYTNTFADGTFNARVGRQEFNFDLQRFVSSRDGPNVRQAFDAAWADWVTGPWKFIGFVSQPVQYVDYGVLNDFSDKSFRFSMLRVERQVLGTSEVSAYYSLYERDNAIYLDAVGIERRNVFDVHFAGHVNGADWDLEAMGQTGEVGAKDIRAWALGGRAGCTFANLAWTPRIGLQADAASGDTHPGDNKIETFNPLFPNGYYFSLGGYTGYSNLIHLKPSITVNPIANLSVMAAVGLQWRQTSADAVYVQTNAVPGTAGVAGLWTGVYDQLRVDYRFNAHVTGAIEAVHYQIGNVVRQAGGHDSDYLGVELKSAW